MTTPVLSLQELFTFLDLNERDAPYTLLKSPFFPFRVTTSYAQRMDKGNWHDPLLLQVVPRSEEDCLTVNSSEDPTGDRQSSPIPGLLHKYSSRVLIMANSRCAVHCRYCFRRVIAPELHCFQLSDFSRIEKYLHENPLIQELILSGGDPLFHTKQHICTLLNQFLSLTAIKTIRIHTRVPIVMPSMVDDQLLEFLAKANAIKRIIIVTHANHAAELRNDCSELLHKMRQRGLLMLNQSVLLKGVNDSIDALRNLSFALIEHGILPYYLHQLDRVQGAIHFEVDSILGSELISRMRSSVPGYALPKYVREIPGASSKLPLP